MCGRFKGPDTWAELHEILGGFVSPPPQPSDKREFRPTNQVPVVMPSGDGYDIAQARWSLIPSWYRKPLKEWKVATFNARLEDIETKATFKTAWTRKQFCLIPAAYFWEWTGPKDARVRMRLGRADNHQLVFAGLYDNATTADGPVMSCTILMHGAGPDIEDIHDREPAILHPDEWEPLLAGRLDRDLKQPVAAGTLRIAEELDF